MNSKILEIKSLSEISFHVTLVHDGPELVQSYLRVHSFLTILSVSSRHAVKIKISSSNQTIKKRLRGRKSNENHKFRRTNKARYIFLYSFIKNSNRIVLTEVFVVYQSCFSQA